jgi:isopenicillin N synthase-like dioxygenase
MIKTPIVASPLADKADMTSTIEAIHVSNSALPVIDISGLSSSSLTDRQTAAEHLRAACIDNGFFYIVNHGVPAALTDDVFAETKRFFDCPAEVKSTDAGADAGGGGATRSQGKLLHRAGTVA